ncbi:MAG: hypothetical protein OXI51_07000 [Chloroflexota bacterium]|nr:hypothetical protein [Chloroflexota bacterium]
MRRWLLTVAFVLAAFLTIGAGPCDTQEVKCTSETRCDSEGNCEGYMKCE